MANTESFGRRALSAVVAAATILWALGAATFAVPQAANAAEAGDLVRGTSLPAVYFVGYDGARYTFPNEKTYDTWFNGFSGVETLSDAAIADMSLAGNVVYRPGSRFIKVESTADTYAVGRNGMIHWIETEDVATDLAGSDWNTNIDDVPDVFFVNYTEGVSLSSATVWDGALFIEDGTYYLSWDGEMRELTSAARSANNLETRFFLDGDAIDSSDLSMGSTISGEVCDVVDASQTGCDEVEVTGGDLSVRASSSTPAGATLPKGANGVSVFSFDVTAGDEDAELNSVTLSLEGVTSATNFDNVYLYEGSSRLTEARSINSSSRSVTFGSLGLDVDAGDTRTLTARVEVSSSATAGDEFYFAVNSSDDLEASGDISGNFPVAGNDFEIGGQSVGTITMTKNGTITNPTIGEDDAVIGQFKLTTSGEDAMLEELTLNIDDAGDHSDFKLWTIDLDLIAEGEYIGDDLVAFDLSDMDVIEDGNSEIFKVSADIGGEASDAVKVFLENDADIVAEGGDYGFGVGVTATGYDGDNCTSTSGDCSYSTIQGGNVTFAFNGPSSLTDVLINAQDQVLLDFTLTSEEEITIKDLDIIVYGDDDGDNDATDAAEEGTDTDTDGLIGATEANISDIKIVDAETGKTVMGPLELDSLTGDDADQTIDFSDDWTLEAGESRHLLVTADIDDGTATGTEFAAAIDISGFVAEDANGDTLTNATDVVPSGDITGNNLTASSASLTIALASTPGDVTTVHGTENVVVNRFNVQGGDVGVVDVSQIVLSVYSDTAANTGTFTLGDHAGAPDVNDYISSCSLYNADDELLAGPESPASNGATITFDSVDWQIEADENEELEVRCNFQNPTATTTYYFAFDIADASEDIVAQDEEGTDVDATSDTPNGGTDPTNVVTVADKGTLSVALSASSPDSAFLLTGTDDNLAAIFRFDATNEDVTVSTLTITEEAAEDHGIEVGGTSTNSSAFANNIERVTIEYPLADGTTGTASKTMSGNESKFTNLNLFVEEGEAAVVRAYVDVAATDRSSNGSATSNEFVALGISNDAGDFEAIGVGSNAAITGAAVSTADRHVVRETAPTVGLSASSPSGVLAKASSLEVFRFNVTAANGEDVILRDLVFEITMTDNGTSDWNQCDTDGADGTFLDDSDFNFFQVGNGTALDTSDTDWTLYKTTGAACDTTAADLGFVQLTLPTAETITAGTTETFYLQVNTSLASSSSDDIIQVSIPDDEQSVASYATASALAEDNLSPTDTTITVASGTAYEAGDIICMDTADDGCGTADEKMLVAGKSTNDLYVVRGYLGTTPNSDDSNDTNDDVDLLTLPSSFLWEDDGDTDADTTGRESWGSYLVDGLPLDGGSIIF